MAAKVLKPIGGHEVSARASKGVERARHPYKVNLHERQSFQEIRHPGPSEAYG
ncbi:hypothetical protein IC232_00250 [Microvirga sp. BT688]|uniref:hypothetical protein n=1 Tax=Microvirga sp. TaxID=1873136 RepID=UPI0016870835|nr:hypothetical protein [Microvirga sp.]MBD2745116.1 hypothetical protein [Microvirga sp.]